jgi:hypothetical protein
MRQALDAHESSTFDKEGLSSQRLIRTKDHED